MIEILRGRMRYILLNDGTIVPEVSKSADPVVFICPSLVHTCYMLSSITLFRLIDP